MVHIIKKLCICGVKKLQTMPDAAFLQDANNGFSLNECIIWICICIAVLIIILLCILAMMKWHIGRKERDKNNEDNFDAKKTSFDDKT